MTLNNCTSFKNTPSNHTLRQQKPKLIIKQLLNADYSDTHNAMSKRTLERIKLAKDGTITPDELWVVEHKDVYTLGQAGKTHHILKKTETPIIKTDRGGQVTWHGKGQLVMYWLFNLTTLGWGVRDLVSHAEQAIEDVINDYLAQPTIAGDSNLTKMPHASLYAKARQDAPGVYIYNTTNNTHSTNHTPSGDGTTPIMLGKIASLGFKIKHNMSYHGIAINLTCDLSPFLAINPCGYAGMTMLRLCDFTELDWQAFTDDLVANIRLRHQGSIALRTS